MKAGDALQNIGRILGAYEFQSAPADEGGRCLGRRQHAGRHGGVSIRARR